MKKAIVTGSNGFIGSNVCKRLCADGIKVFAVVKDENENIDNIKNLSAIEIVYCELDEIEALADIISDRDIDVFYHFAWVGSAGSLRCDENVQLKNALWTARALRTADGMQCKKFVNAGSIKEKETYTAVYTQESKPGLPYIYGAGKLIARAICKPIANSLSIDLCWAVITNAYGVGELSPRFVNSTIRKIIANEPLQFTAATQNYDFIYIDDVARAFEAIGEHGKPNKEYTIGSGNARPLKEFILEMQQTLAPNAKPIFGDVPFTGINMPLEAFDTADIKRDCQFGPSVSFDEVVSNADFEVSNLIIPFCATDLRGAFIKDYSKEVFEANGLEHNLAEVFYTVSHKGVIRALHFQRVHEQAKLVRCIKGKVFDVIVDLRPESPTFKKWQGFYLSEENMNELYVPEHFAHGYLVLEPSVVSYKCGEKFYGEYDDGIMYNDPDLGVEWPFDEIGGIENLIIADKD